MNFDRLTQVFRQTFEDDELVLTPELSAREVLQWDSFNHINLVIMIEIEFSVRLTTDEIGDMRNVGDLVSTLKEKGIEIDWPE
jgi:acyl carrier protein